MRRRTRSHRSRARKKYSQASGGSLRQCPQGPALVSRHGMTAVECCLIEVSKGVPKVGQYLVAGRRFLASLPRQTPRPSCNLMSCPNQRLLFRPLRTEVPRRVEFSRTPVLHALVRPAVSVGLPADLTNALNWSITASAHIWTKDRQVSSSRAPLYAQGPAAGPAQVRNLHASPAAQKRRSARPRPRWSGSSSHGMPRRTRYWRSR
jgi:hypothetical protein